MKNAASRLLLSDQGSYDTKAAGDAAYIRDYPYFHKKGWNVLYLDGHVKWIEEGIVAKYGKPTVEGGLGQPSATAMLNGFNAGG